LLVVQIQGSRLVVHNICSLYHCFNLYNLQFRIIHSCPLNPAMIVAEISSSSVEGSWHLLNDERNDVTICDHQDDVAPSRDVSKILRIDYPDPERMKEVMRSNSLWKNDSVFNGYYKRTGRVVAYSKVHIETLLGIDLARSQLGLPPRKRQRAQLLEDLFHSAQVASDLTVVHNEDDGVVDWTGAMKSVKEDCLRKGGKFRNDRVIRMEVNTTGKVQAIVTSTESINTENTEIILIAQSSKYFRTAVNRDDFEFENLLIYTVNVWQWKWFRGGISRTSSWWSFWVCNPHDKLLPEKPRDL